jgi:hypothetical protein
MTVTGLMMTRRTIKPVLVAALAAFLVAALGTTVTDIGPWYRGLAKPSWQPPDWLFGPAWTLIYTLAALSAAHAWRDAPGALSRKVDAGFLKESATRQESRAFFRLDTGGEALAARSQRGRLVPFRSRSRNSRSQRRRPGTKAQEPSPRNQGQEP